MIRAFISFALVTFFGLGAAQAIEKIPAEQKGVEVVNALLKALTIEDEAARVKAVLPLVHKSLKSSDGADLTATIRRYSFKKASDAAKLYASPAAIFEVHKGRTVTIGFKETAERGRTDKYFVKKKEGVAGRPAPIHVFWPEGGGAPTIVNFGSL